MRILKSALLSSALVLGLASPLLAADLPNEVQAGSPSLPVSSPEFDWTGFYAGANIGLGFSGKFDNNGALANDGVIGFLGGGVVGYNYQLDNFVIGLEGDINYLGGEANGAAGLNADLDFLGSITGRLGVTPRDRVLTYIEAGYAFGQADLATPTASDTNLLHGFTVGAGTEYAVTDNVLAGIEYNYTNLGSETFNLGAAGVQTSDFDTHTLKFNLKYKF